MHLPQSVPSTIRKIRWPCQTKKSEVKKCTHSGAAFSGRTVLLLKKFFFSRLSDDFQFDVNSRFRRERKSGDRVYATPHTASRSRLTAWRPRGRAAGGRRSTQRVLSTEVQTQTGRGRRTGTGRYQPHSPALYSLTVLRTLSWNTWLQMLTGCFTALTAIILIYTCTESCIVSCLASDLLLPVGYSWDIVNMLVSKTNRIISIKYLGDILRKLRVATPAHSKRTGKKISPR